jgi:hypothetical protein
MAMNTVISQVLLFHVVSGSVLSSDLSNDQTINSVEGSRLRANIYLRSNYYDVGGAGNGGLMNTCRDLSPSMGSGSRRSTLRRAMG